MRNLLKILFVILLGLPFCSFAQEKIDTLNTNREASILPANNLDLLFTAHMLGYVFKWYQDELPPKDFINPFVIAAVGRPAGGGYATTAEEINEWIFFSTLMHNSQQPVYTLETHFKKGKFEPIVLKKMPFMGVEFFSLTEVKLSLDEAIDLIRTAGFTQPFKVVDLFKPLHPNAKEIVYVFTMEEGKHVFVGTISKEVFTEEKLPAGFLKQPFSQPNS